METTTGSENNNRKQKVSSTRVVTQYPGSLLRQWYPSTWYTRDRGCILCWIQWRNN